MADLGFSPTSFIQPYEPDQMGEIVRKDRPEFEAVATPRRGEHMTFVKRPQLIVENPSPVEVMRILPHVPSKLLMKDPRREKQGVYDRLSGSTTPSSRGTRSGPLQENNRRSKLVRSATSPGPTARKKTAKPQSSKQTKPRRKSTKSASKQGWSAAERLTRGMPATARRPQAAAVAASDTKMPIPKLWGKPAVPALETAAARDAATGRIATSSRTTSRARAMEQTTLDSPGMLRLKASTSNSPSNTARSGTTTSLRSYSEDQLKLHMKQQPAVPRLEHRSNGSAMVSVKSSGTLSQAWTESTLSYDQFTGRLLGVNHSKLSLLSAMERQAAKGKKAKTARQRKASRRVRKMEEVYLGK